jgi:hypothetical protein
MQHFGRFRSGADMSRQTRPARLVANDPKADIAFRADLWNLKKTSVRNRSLQWRLVRVEDCLIGRNHLRVAGGE